MRIVHVDLIGLRVRGGPDRHRSVGQRDHARLALLAERGRLAVAQPDLVALRAVSLLAQQVERPVVP